MYRRKKAGHGANLAGDNPIVETTLNTLAYTLGTSVADASYFRPDSAVIRSATLGVPPKQFFTFPDGKDDNREISPLNRPGADIVEIDAYAKKQDNILRNELKKAKFRKEVQQSLGSATPQSEESNANS